MAWDNIWEDIFSSQGWGKYPSEDLIRFIARNFYQARDRKEVKVLEVGCGTGANLWYVAREGFTIYGIDGSKTAIEIAKTRLDVEVEDWSGQLVVGDFISLPYEDNFFDAVIDNEAVYSNSYENSQVIYNEIHRVLKPKGKLYSRTFAAGSWGDGTGEQVAPGLWVVSEGPAYGKGTTRFSTEKDIKNLLEKYEITELEQIIKTCNNLSEKIIEWVIIASKR
ncbi:class I SAM-dependent methyltransferase [Paenibacillus sp. PK3_47]|uniref:class I SAM-dependent methyltransferase n=1 Tax=Paenibacillus sp. PK3_47 TaxID=2072642 RepID=UPI00201E667D|nr:class I SAM-dependent methyltransferase [Paenibacillus sp. PK3_47]